MASLLSAALVLVAAVAVPPKGRTFKAYGADIRLPLPSGWELDKYVYERSPDIPVRGRKCWNSIWFDFIPAATLAYTRQLIDTETIEMTRAVRTWHERMQSGIELASRPAVQLRFPDIPERTVYLMAAAGGTLVMQVMSNGDKPEQCAAARRKAADQLVALFFAPDVLGWAETLSRTRGPPALKAVEPVPTNLEECFVRLKKKLGPEDLEALRTGTLDEATLHFGLGMGLRNAWGLWSGSPLARYFRDMGVFHPDDMSGIILTSFIRHLRGEPLLVEEQAAESRRYWANMQPPETKRCGDGRSAVRLFVLEGTRERLIHVYECPAGKQLWVYEFDKGWSRPDGKLARRIGELRNRPGLESAPLEE